MRQVILDTETTGLKTEDGHRIIEIGAVELVDRKLTGKHFHQYINPRREVDAGALAVHGITDTFLKDKPYFEAIASAFMTFVSGAELIIHNAPFDTAFIDYEFSLLRQGHQPIAEICAIIDTLPMARKMHIGQRNSLDALCKRYGVDNTKREWHGALLDANLLAQVYLAMTGGQGSFFDQLNDNEAVKKKGQKQNEASSVQYDQLIVIKAAENELLLHENYLQKMKEHGKCAWLSD